MNARCPTCDRDGRPMFPTPPVHEEEPRDECPGCVAPADCHAHRVDWRARALAAETAAAQWAKVAPLIERLRHTRRHAKPDIVVTALDNLLAATEDAP